MKLRSWIRNVFARPACRTGRKARARERLHLETLEDRTLPVVSVVPGTGNAVSILGTVGDQLWLRTNAAAFQYSTDATNYADLGVRVTQDATITLGGLGQVHLMNTVGQGHAITLQALGAPDGSAGQLASPNLLTVEGTVTTAGGDLSILNMQGVEVYPNVVVSTRNIGSSAEYLEAPSVGDSGALTLTSENPDTLNPILNIDFNHPHVTLDSGARVLAQVGEGDTTHKAGDVTLSARNTNFSLGSSAFSGISALAREASVKLAGATVRGARVDVTSDAGDQSLLGELAQLGGGNANWAAGFIVNSLPMFSDLASMPVSFLLKKADSAVVVGQGAAESFTLPPLTGELTFSAPHGLSTGDAVTYTSGGTAITGLTAGATYFAIVDSGTTLRLAASRDEALHAVPLPGLDATRASGTQSLSPNSQISGADVKLLSNATSDAEGSAISYGQLSPFDLRSVGADSFQLAFAVAVGIPTANTLVDSGSQITAEGDVEVESNASSTTSNVARVSQNYGVLSSVQALLGAQETDQARLQLAGGVGVDRLTAHTTVAEHADIEASGSATVKAAGRNIDKNIITTASYSDGVAGVSLAFNFSSADVRAFVDGTVTAGGPAAIGRTSTAPVSLTFDPFSSVHGSDDPTEPNTIDLGTADPGLHTGDPVVYDTGLGGAIDGLTSGATYFVIDASVPGDHRIQLAPSRADALARRNVVVLPPNPTLTDPTSGKRLPFTQVSETVPYPFDAAADVSDNVIRFPSAHGLTTGQAVTYSAGATPLAGFTGGRTYYVVAVGKTGIELADTYAHATAATPVVLPLAGGAGIQTLTPQTPIEFGFAHGFSDGEALVYHAVAGKGVNGLTDGQTYYAELVPNSPGALLLSATRGGPPIRLDLSPVLTSPDGSRPFTVTSIDSASGSFLFDPALGYSFTPGEALVYRGALGTKIPGLTDGATYYAVVDANNGYALQLAPTVSAALAASAAATQLSTAQAQASTLTGGGTVGTVLYLDPAANQIVFMNPAPDFASLQPLVYHEAPGNSIGGLQDGQTYYALPVPGNPNAVRLAADLPSALLGTAIVLDPRSRLTGDTQTLDLASTDPSTGTLYLAAAPTAAVATGDPFVYHAAVGNGIQSLVDGRTYYAIVLGDPTTLQLAATAEEAVARKAVALSPTLTDPGGNGLLIQRLDSQTHTLTLHAPLDSALNTGDAVVYHANGASVPGLLDGATYYVVNNQSGGINPIAFTGQAVSAGGSALRVPGHGFYTGEAVTYTTGGTAIGGLANNGIYYVIVLDGSTIQLAASLADATSGRALTLSETVAGGTQTLTPPAAAGKPVTFAPSPVVDPAAHTISLPSHGLVTGQAVTYTVAAGGTPIQGLTPGHVYYVLVVDDDTIRLAASPSGPAVAVDATGAGGAQTFTPLRGSDTPVHFQPGAVSGSADAINLPNHGFVTGEAVTYKAAGDAIGGLSTSTVYYVIVVDGNTIELAATAADAFAGNALPLDPAAAAGEQSLSPEQAPARAFRVNLSAVRAAGDTFTLADHGLVTGEAVTYTTTGQAIGGLTPGTVYYVIVVDGSTIRLAASQGDAYDGKGLDVNPAGASGTQTLAPAQPVLQLAASYADATAVTPVVFSLGGAIDFGTVDNAVMAGTGHTLTARPAGLSIEAELESHDLAITKSGIGGQPAIIDFLTQGALLASGAGTSLLSLVGPEIGGPIFAALNKANSASGQNQALDLSIAGSLAVVNTAFTVTAEVGPHAVLKSATDVTVEGLITELEQTSVEAAVSKPEHESNVSTAVALQLGVFHATAQALVDDHAVIDAAGSLEVHANTTYPFVLPLRNLSWDSLTRADAAGGNPLLGLESLLLSGNLGLQFFLVNNFTRTASHPESGAPENALGLAFSLDLNVYDNTAVARIGSGAEINQDPVYRTPGQSVEVAAETYIDEVNITGMFAATPTADTAVKASRGKGKLTRATKAGLHSLFDNPLFGNQAGEGGLGVSAPFTVVTTTATAEIDAGALIHVGAEGSLDVTANDRNVFVILAQSGGQAKAAGLSGTVSVLAVTAHTTAQIHSGVTVTGGGAVEVAADDDSNLINLAGAFQDAQELSVGISAAVNVLDRNTFAVVGEQEGSPTAIDPPAGSSTYGGAAVPLEDLTVSATERGNLVTSAVAASVVAADPGTKAASAKVLGHIGGGLPEGVAQVGGTFLSLVFGVSASGAASLNLLPADNAQAYINDRGTFHVGDASLSADNATHIVSVTGGVGLSLKAFKGIGLAGTYSENTVNGTTRAFVEGATLEAEGLTVHAERSGFDLALSAGVEVATGIFSSDFAVAVAVNTITGGTEAFVRDAEVSVAGDASVTAVNDDQIWSLNGSALLGGLSGKGAAISVNVIDEHAYAYLADSVVSQSEGALTVAAANQNFGALSARIIAATAATGAAESSAAVGTVSVNLVADDTEAYLLGTTYSNSTPGESADVTASDSSGIISLAGALGIGGFSGYGVAGGFNFVSDTTRAFLEGSTASLLGDLNVTARSTSAIGSVTLGVAAAGIDSSAAGSVSANQIADTIDAHISRATAADPQGTTGNVSSVQTSGDVVVATADTSVLVSVAGGVAISGPSPDPLGHGSAVGAALSYSVIQNTLTSYVDGTTLTTAKGGVSVSADSTPVLVNLAAGGAGAFGFAFGGSLTINAIANTVNSRISNSTVNALDSVVVTASESPVMVVLAGGIAVSGTSGAIGAAIAYNFIGGSFDPANPDHVTKPGTAQDQVGAAIENSSVTSTDGDVTVLAGYAKPSALPGTQVSLLSAGTVTLPIPVSQALVSIAVGSAGGDEFALGGSVNVNLMRGSADAHISNTPVGKKVQAGGNVVVGAADGSTIGSGAGALAVALSGGAVGAAISTNDIQNRVVAGIDGAAVQGNQVQVGTTENATIVNVTAAGAGAGNFALGGSLSVNLIRNTVDAHIGSGASVTGSSLVSVTAGDTSTIDALSGAGAFAVHVSVGVAAAVSDIANTTTATIAGAATGVTASAGDVVVSAQSTPSILTVAAGVAVSGELNGVAVAGSSAVNVMANHVDAAIDAATVTADGNVAVLARTDATLHSYGGTIDGAILTGVGGSVVVNYLGNSTTARLDNGAHVTARGHGNAVGVTRWAHDGNGTESTEFIHGLAVVATSHETVVDIATTVSLAGGVGVGFNFEANIFNDTTDAHIADSFVNSASDQGQAVIVRAHTAIAATGAGGTVAVGILGVGAAIDTEVYLSATRALITGSTVFAGGDVEVSALTREDVTSAAAGASVGGFNFAGGVSGVVIGGSTSAAIQNGSNVNSHRNLTVRADDGVNLHLGDGVLGGGVLAGAGGAVAVAVIGHSTSAVIDASTTNATGLTLIEADATETLLDVVIAAGVGGITGVAGAIGVVSLGATVTAAITAASVNQDDNYKTSTQDVTVKAKDTASVTDGIGAAGGGAVGVGAGVDVITIKDVVAAYVGDNSQVSAGRNITVEADGDKAFSSNVFSFALAGVASLNGTVSVVGIGGGLDSRGVSQLQNIQGTVNANLSLNGGVPGLNPGIGTEQNAQALTRTDALNIDGALSTDQTPRDTEAYVGKNVTLEASGDVRVTATETLHPSAALAGQGTGAVGLSVGASVAVIAINSAVQAFVQDGTTIDAGGDVTVAAHFTDDVSARSFAGTVGFVGLGAQVSIITDNAVEVAILGNIQVTRANALTVSATADRKLDAEAAGGTAGGLVAGAAVASASANGSTNAALGGQIGQAAGGSVGAVNVSAASNDSARAFTVAVAAGIGAGSVNVSQASVAPTVAAAVADNTAITSTGGVAVTAGQTPHADAEGFGASVGGALSVGAVVVNANVAGATSAHVGNGARVAAPGLTVAATRAPHAGFDTTAHANAGAGTGGVLVGVNATFSTATAGGTVQASTGNGVTLPDGDVAILASNQTLQSAGATGVTAEGLLAVGSVNATATSGGTTSAQLGSVVTHAGRTGALTVRATGTDENDASATAGSGGILAGNAAVSHTGDNSTVSAVLGGGVLVAGTVDVSATHHSVYTPNASSINAAVLGASGALATNDDNTTASATVLPNTVILASSAVDIAALNTFTEGANSVFAGAGGVFNGAAAQSQSTITGNSNVTIGSGVLIDVEIPGTSGASHPGIYLTAASTLDAIDTVTLSNGGAIAGAGTDSSLSATLNNNVVTNSTTASPVNLVTNANIGIGTHTRVNAGNTSEASSFGVLGTLASASAETNVTSNQNVTLGSGTNLTAVGNVTITAGDDPKVGVDGADPIVGNANAQSYARGLVGIPLASATTNLTSNATLTVAAGAQIRSGQNTTLAADTGTPFPTAQGVGHGYELFFIPVTNGSSSTSTPTNLRVVIDGTVMAGIYHELDITIPNAVNPQTGRYDTLNANAGGFPFAYAFNPSFVPSDFVQSNFSPSTAATLTPFVSSTPVGAISLGPLFAAGGDVIVGAGTLLGHGSVTAYGGPTISVTNDSPDYLLLGPINIPDLPGGSVQFTGNAQAAPGGMTVTQVSPGASPVVTIQQRYPGAVGTSPNHSGPAVFLTGAVSNPGGSLTITNLTGSVGLTATASDSNVGRLTIVATQGALVVSQPTGTFISGSSPYAEWDPYLLYPGGNPHTQVLGATAARNAVAWVANALYNANAQYGTSDFGPGPLAANSLAFTADLIGQVGETPAYYAIRDGFPTTPLVPRQHGTSVEFLGANSGYDTSYTLAQAIADSPVGWAYPMNPSGAGLFPLVPVEPLSASANAYPTPSGSTALQAGAIEIDANVIDCNNTFTVGRSNDLSIALPATLVSTLAGFDQDHLLHPDTVLYTVPVATLVAGGATTPPQFDVQYNAVTRQLIVNRLSASSGGGFIRLHGQIMNTNLLGNINVNDGIGQVTIDNQVPNIAVVVNDVSAGSNPLNPTSALSVVDIIDTRQPAATGQTLYVYRPALGQVAQYQGPADLSVLQLQDPAYLRSVTAGSSASYSPQAGLRWQWQLQANLSRTVTFVNPPNQLQSYASTPWAFSSAQFDGEVNNNDPWYFLGPDGRPTAPTASGTGSTPYGQLVVQAGLPVFQETITGTIDDWAAAPGAFHFGQFGFVTSNPPETDPADGQLYYPWEYFFITDATLTLTNSVKADNPIAIHFFGPAQSFVHINSVSPVILAGNILDPDGATTIDAPNVKQTSDASITASSLAITTTLGGVGMPDQPLNATLAGDGALSIDSQDSVYVNLGSGALLTVSARFGDVVIHANGSLDTPHPGLMNVRGQNITLTSATGEVGSAAAPLLIQAGGSSGNAGVVNVTALGDIGLTQSQGNLKVDQVVSTQGDVTVNVPDGRLLNGSGTAWANVVGGAQSQQVWQDLGLTDPSAAQQQAVTAFQNQVNAAYQGYWQLLHSGSVGSGVLTLNAQGLANYRTQAGQALTPPTDSPTDAQVQVYANGLYQGYVALFDQNLGPTWRTAPDFQTYNANFRYQATAQQVADLQANAGWTTAQLTNAIAQVALNPADGTTVGLRTPNVAGKNVTLTSSQSIGQGDLSGTFFSLADLQAGVPLPNATAPGDLLLVGTEGTSTVTVPLGQEPPGFVLTGVLVSPTEQLFISATGTLKLTANGAIVIQSTGQDVTLGQVAGGGGVNIAAPGSILSDGNAGSGISTSGDLVLKVDSGTVGLPTARLNVGGVGGSVSVYTPPDSAFLTGVATITGVTHPAAVEGINTGTVTVATFTDNSDIGNLSATITWADGQTSAGTVVATATPGNYQVTGSHTYAEEILTPTHFTVTVKDSNRPPVSRTINTATVADAPLTVTSVAHPAAFEGIDTGTVTVATFTDAAGAYSEIEDLSATITWADGQTSAGTVVATSTPGRYTVTGSHTYAEEILTPTRFTVAVRDSGGASDSRTITTATVADAPLTVTSVTHPAATEGINTGTVTFATFTDAAGAYSEIEDLSATITWADGSTSAGTVVATGTPGSYRVTGSHTYLDDVHAPSNFTVAVRDAGGSSDSGTIHTVTVANATPVVGAIRGPSSAIPGQTLTLSAPFTDLGILDTHTGTFVWGDGTSNTVNAVETLGSGTVSAAHIYAASGTYTVTLKVTDDDGGISLPATFTVTVTQSAYLLNSSASGAFTASGNAVINFPGSLVVDSSSSTALIASGKASVTANEIIVVGGDQVSGNAVLNPSPTLHAAGVADPLAALAAPGVTGTPVAVNLAGQQSRTISPGIYSQIQVSGQASLTMLPGVYVIAGGGFSVSGNASVTGDGVMIYNAGSKYSYNPTTGVVSDGGTYGSVSLSGNGTINLSAPASGQPYTGVILFQPRANARPLSLSGNGAAGTLGTIYAPAAAAGLSGNAQLKSTLVVSTLSVTGNAGAFQLAGGAGSPYASSTSNWITNGILTVAVQDDTGNGLDDNAVARLDNAMSYLNQALGSFGVYLSWAEPGTGADVHLHFANSTPEGGAGDGVMGFTTAANDVYFVTGWNFSTSPDGSAVGADQYDFLTLATHELAHTVGLGESSDPGSVMYEYLRPGTVRRTFTESNLALINTNADRFMKVGGGFLPAPGAAAGPLADATALAQVFALQEPGDGGVQRVPSGDSLARVVGDGTHPGATAARLAPVRADVLADWPGSPAGPFALWPTGADSRRRETLAGGSLDALVGGEGDERPIGTQGMDVLVGGFGRYGFTGGDGMSTDPADPLCGPEALDLYFASA